MDMSTVFHNGSLSAAEQLLTSDVTLAHGAAIYQSTEGSPKDKLREAIQAMVSMNKKRVEYIVFDCDLETYTVPQLRSLARRHDVLVFSDDRKHDLIRKLHAEQRRRVEFS
jgi:hypothetical protein